MITKTKTPKTKTPKTNKSKTKPKTKLEKTDGVAALRSDARFAVLARIVQIELHYAELLHALRVAARKAENNYRSQSPHADKRMLPPRLAAAVAAMSEVPVIVAEIQQLRVCEFELSDARAGEYRLIEKSAEEEFLRFVEAKRSIMTSYVSGVVGVELRALARCIQWLDSNRAVQDYLQVGRLRRAKAPVRTSEGALAVSTGRTGRAG